MKLWGEERVEPSWESWGHHYLRQEEELIKRLRGLSRAGRAEEQKRVTGASGRMRRVSTVKFKAAISKELHKIRMTSARNSVSGAGFVEG